MEGGGQLPTSPQVGVATAGLVCRLKTPQLVCSKQHPHTHTHTTCGVGRVAPSRPTAPLLAALSGAVSCAVLGARSRFLQLLTAPC